MAHVSRADGEICIGRADNIAGFLKLYKLQWHELRYVCKSSVIGEEIRSIVSILMKMRAPMLKFFST